MCDLYEMLYTEALKLRAQAEAGSSPSDYLAAAEAFADLQMSAAAQRMMDRAIYYTGIRYNTQPAQEDAVYA